jgi:HSP20 family protein
MTLIKRTHRPVGFPSIFDDLFTDTLWATPTERLFKGSAPAVNIKETEAGFELEMAAPGLSKEDFQIHLENDVLTISSSKKKDEEVKTEDGKYHRREFHYSSFSRAFTLPELADIENIQANYNHGVLKLNIPFKPAAVIKKKEITVG